MLGRTVHNVAVPPVAQPSSEMRSGRMKFCVCSQCRVASASSMRSREARALDWRTRHCGPSPREPNEYGNTTAKPSATRCCAQAPYSCEAALGRWLRPPQSCSATTAGNGPGPEGRYSVACSVRFPSGISTCSAATDWVTQTSAAPANARIMKRKFISATWFGALAGKSSTARMFAVSPAGAPFAEGFTAACERLCCRNPPTRTRQARLRAAATERDLLNRTDRSGPIPGGAEDKYLDGDFRVIRPGVFVRCAVTGAEIPLEELRYWSVDLQEAYASPEAVLQRHAATLGHKK